MNARYLVFVYMVYYPCGGFNDLAGFSDDLEAAKAMLEAESAAMVRVYSDVRGHIVDTRTGEVVATNPPRADIPFEEYRLYNLKGEVVGIRREYDE